MSRIDLTLPDDLKAFVDAETAARGFDGAGAYIQDVLCQLWRHKAKAALAAEIVAPTESGPAVEATPEFWAALLARLRQRR